MPRERNSYTSKVLRFALCNPRGRPVYVSSTVRKALAQYVDMRGGIIVDDVSEARYWRAMKIEGWSICYATITLTFLNPVEELPDEEASKEVKSKARRKEGPQDRQAAKPKRPRSAQGDKTKSPRKSASLAPNPRTPRGRTARRNRGGDG